MRRRRNRHYPWSFSLSLTTDTPSRPPDSLRPVRAPPCCEGQEAAQQRTGFSTRTAAAADALEVDYGFPVAHLGHAAEVSVMERRVVSSEGIGAGEQLRQVLREQSRYVNREIELLQSACFPVFYWLEGFKGGMAMEPQTLTTGTGQLVNRCNCSRQLTMFGRRFVYVIEKYPPC